MKQSFEHQGCTYTVQTKTAFDADLYGSLLWDVASIVLRDMGIALSEDGTINLDAVPKSLDALISRYVNAMQMTRFEGDKPAFAVDIYQMKDASAFKAWRDAIREDETLYKQWFEAIATVNRVDNSPKL